MNKDVIFCYKYYDERKRRLAIMAENKGETIDVTVITCSRKDPFTKKEARRALENLSLGQETFINGDLVHPQRFIVPSTGNFKEGFFSWAQITFFKLRYRAKWEPVLIGDGGKITRKL